MNGEKSGKRSSVKKKAPWLWTKDLLTSQKERLEDYEDYEVKSWKNFMINRFLSMKSDWIEVVNEVQKYPLSPKELYRVYRDILPRRNQFLKYVNFRLISQYFVPFCLLIYIYFFDFDLKNNICQ